MVITTKANFRMIKRVVSDNRNCRQVYFTRDSTKMITDMDGAQ